jgi:hypothetical protein
MLIIYTIYYLIDLNHKLNKLRKQLVFREKYQRFKNTKTNISPEYDINMQLIPKQTSQVYIYFE